MIIYEPKGAAREYCDLALNIYTGCTNGCYYCYAPKVLHKQREQFHEIAALRPVVTPERVTDEIVRHGYEGRTIQLCFTCDPYPAFTDTAPTRKVIRAIKNAGANVQILTKRPKVALRDIDLLTRQDHFGVTLTAFGQQESNKWEPNAEGPDLRILALETAHQRGIPTWASFEPVVRPSTTLELLKLVTSAKICDVVKIGKMNYAETPEPINWAAFGRRAEEICRQTSQAYYIKAGLKKEMERV